ncbi:hypothetical protein Golax_023952 [Gossypium laxum]|uniref:Uncharacterized protein n=1 Tax=Gossypium laxum TaxID=34288 RepID=A0A7J8ZAL0_9ROSI|nr:hypothetical protein [Gossypium laxum]
MCNIVLLQSSMLMLQTLCKPFLTILNSCFMSMLRILNPHFPL